MYFSIQMFFMAAVLILAIWFSGRRKVASEKASKKSLPDLRSYLGVTDHQVLAAIRKVEALASDWHENERDKTAREQGIEGMTLLARTLEERQVALKRYPDDVEILETKLAGDLLRMQSWLEGRVKVIEMVSDDTTPTHSSSTGVH